MQAKLLGELRFTAEVNILLRCALQASLAVRVRRRPKKKKKKWQKQTQKRSKQISHGAAKKSKEFPPLVLQVQMSVLGSGFLLHPAAVSLSFTVGFVLCFGLCNYFLFIYAFWQ